MMPTAVQELDPQRDHEQMARWIATRAFPFDARMAMQFAVLRTFGIPQIANALVRSGTFLEATAKRIERTEVLLNGLVEHGYSSEEGQRIIARINHAHAHLDSNTDIMRYVLATFIFEPVRWVQRFGWRALTAEEVMAAFQFWREVGLRLHIDVPADRAEFEAFYDRFEVEHMVFHPDNHRLAVAVREHMLLSYAAPLRPIVRTAMHAFIDERLSVALGLPRAGRPARLAAPSLARAGSWVGGMVA